MQAPYEAFSGLDLPQIEAAILTQWTKEAAFEQSISLREGRPPFVFYEGPPSANGMPGIHHVISRTLKDMVCRYKTMQGFQVKRKGGWDTHGLPIELGVEKELGITKEDIGKTISVEDYNQKCREAVLRYKKEWDQITRKMGYWVDLDHPYVTFENDYIETLWWILKELYNKGFLYESVSIQPYSPAAGTGLSSHELNQPGTYKDVKDTSAVAMFKAINNEKSSFLFEATNTDQIFFLAWTTTPWTLPSNLGLTVGPNIQYEVVKTFNPYTAKPCVVILAQDLLHKYFKPGGYSYFDDERIAGNPEVINIIENWIGRNSDEYLFNNATEQAKALITSTFNKGLPYERITQILGSDLEGWLYEQLIPFEANSPIVIQSITPGAEPFKVILGDFVTTEDGTGIVHTAPAFGADDFKVGKKANIGILTLVDREGKFVDGLGEFSGRYVKNYKDDPAYVDVNVDLCVHLKKNNRAFKVEKYEHSYPHCWRTDKPILYYPLDAWFIKTTAVKDRMVELNKTIQWKPASTGEGRFGNWLENMVDWNLSRSRYWGTPLPIWRTADGSEEVCIGSIEELNAAIRKANEVLGGEVNKNYLHAGILDLHKPYVDEIVLVSPSGQAMHRVPDLIDVWFDSGAMPYAQWHYPFANKDLVDKGAAFPADFIAEGVDQTRGWFYTLHALAVMLFDSVAYKTVVSNGLVLDKNGNKMSKRLGNVVNPFDTINQFGADATRWYLITNASPWDNLKFDLAGIQEVQRKFFGTLYNTYQFFTLYANVDGFTYQEADVPLAERPEIDRWILSALNSLVAEVQQHMDHYEPTLAGRAIEYFTDAQLSNWYVRLCRRRFWKGEYGTDKISAYQTLYTCLETLVKLIAPVSPFFSDALFRKLNAATGRDKVVSVHHALFPQSQPAWIDADLEARMALTQEACSLVLSLRKKVNIKVRQPLQKIMVPVLDPTMQARLSSMEELIKAEVNIKEIQYISAGDGQIHKKIKANFKTLGARLGPQMKAAAAAIAALSQVEIQTLEAKGSFALPLEGGVVEIGLADVEIVAEDIPGWSVAAKGPLTIALDIHLTDDLKREGDARELVNRIQNIRKESGFALTDRIFVRVPAASGLQESINQFNDYICREILADSIDFVPELDGGTEIEVNETLLKVEITQKG